MFFAHRPVLGWALPLLLCALGWLPAGCGGGSSAAGAGARSLVVSAAASLKLPFERYGSALSRRRGIHVNYSFAGSDELAAQIAQGLKPDVFASANLKLPRALMARGLVGLPVRFAANRLVIARPAAARGGIESVADLGRRGVKVAIGSPAVPVGEYARSFLSRLAPSLRRAILANVRDEEPDVSGIVGKLAAGAVDAGFVYRSDVTASGGALRAIALPRRLVPPVVYAAAIVTGARHRAAARAFIEGLLHGAGRRQLVAAGFLAAPTENRKLVIR